MFCRTKKSKGACWQMYFVVAGELVVYSPQDRPPAKIDARLENLKKKIMK